MSPQSGMFRFQMGSSDITQSKAISWLPSSDSKGYQLAAKQ